LAKNQFGIEKTNRHNKSLFTTKESFVQQVFIAGTFIRIEGGNTWVMQFGFVQLNERDLDNYL